MSNFLSTISGITFSAPSTRVYAKAVPVTFAGQVSGTALSALGVQYQEIWQFGDGKYSYDSTPTHTYNDKGVYPVTYTVIVPNSATGEVNDEIRTVTATVSVFNYIEDSIVWSSGAPGTFQSVPQSVPFVISLSSSNVDVTPPLVQLYSRGSQSQPWQDPQQKWSHLKPQWRFTDLSGNVISTIEPTNYTTITIDQSGNRTLDNSGFVVGLSSSVSCYYIDDLPSQNLDNTIVPVTLVATLITSGYQVDDNTVRYVPSYMNSGIKSETTHNIRFLEPDHLKVTVNGITPMSDIIWKDAYTPYTVTVHPAAPYADVILKNFPLTNFLINSFTQSLSNVPASSVTFNEAIKLNRYDDDGFDAGGYFRGTFYPLVSADKSAIEVAGTVVYGALAEPFGAWVSNPYYHQLVYVTVSEGQSNQEFLSAVYTVPDSQIYGIARVTGDVNDASWVTDPTNDKVYRISRSFGIDRTFDLSTYPTFSAFAFDNDFGVTPTGIVLNSSRIPWVTLFDASSTIKMDPDTGAILSVAIPPFSSVFLEVPGVSGFGGEYTIRPNKVEVDSTDNVWISYNHPLSSFICKYEDNGSFLLKVDLPTFSQPYDLIVDNQDNVWVTLTRVPSAFSVPLSYEWEVTDNVGGPSLRTVDGTLTVDKNGNWTFTGTSTTSGGDVGELHENYFYTGVDFLTATQYLVSTDTLSSYTTSFTVSGQVVAGESFFGLSGSNPLSAVESVNLFTWNGSVVNQPSATYIQGVDHGAVQKYNSTGTLLSSFEGFRYPSYATLDFYQNLWFINDYNFVTRVDNVSAGTITYLMSSTALSSDPPAPVTIDGRLYDQELGGISCDWFNRVWVLNSYDNRIYMIDADIPASRKELQINPAINNFSYSLQGYGDWHGLQWFNKFGYAPLTAIGDNVTLNLQGQSNVFSIQDFETSYDLRKIHEDFDGVNKIRDITLQQNLKRNDILFSTLIAPIAGTYDGDPLLLGTAIYEKIANYVANHGDVDTCNIPQLYSLHEMIDIPIDQYQLSYPADIKRIMDVLSVSLTRLKPTRSKFSKDFKKYNVASSGKNIGTLIDTATYTASAGQNIVANIKYSTNYEKIELTPITADVLNVPQLSATYANYPLSAFPLSSFPLSAYYGWGLDTPVGEYYFFYEYVPGYDNTQVEGTIDWDNTHTTLTENISSIDDWYKDGGLVDLIFNYYIFRGLGLIKD
jgi:hypothetical protein